MWIASLVGIGDFKFNWRSRCWWWCNFAALIVLPAMGLPVTLIALLISIEPLIDMGRTALNVNGSMTAGVVTKPIYGADRQNYNE